MNVTLNNLGHFKIRYLAENTLMRGSLQVVSCSQWSVGCEAFQ